MNSGVKIIKRNRGPESLPLSHHEKTARQSEREITGIVKNWIVQLANKGAPKNSPPIGGYGESHPRQWVVVSDPFYQTSPNLS